MTAPVRSGEMVADKYRVDRVLGEGAMGVVVAATHLALEESVAIKIMHADLAHQSGARERFMQEARVAARLKSDHVTRVSDVGELPGGNPFIVMEYLEGHDLGELLSRRGAVTPELAAEWVIEACDAVHEAHQNGVVHRDLKPENLFLAARPDGSTRIKVLDFGVSKLMATADGPSPSRQRAMTNGAIGTPAYMAPEQMTSSQHVGPHTDVWALGVILYELVAGRHPFEGATLAEFCGRILRDEPAALGSMVPGIHPELSEIVRCAMHKDWRLRISSASELRERLARLGGSVAGATIGAPIDLCETGAPSEWTDRRVAFTVQPARRARSGRGWIWIAGAAVVVLLGGAGAVWAERAGHPGSPDPAVEPDRPAAMPAEDSPPVAVDAVTVVVEPAAPQPDSSASSAAPPSTTAPPTATPGPKPAANPAAPPPPRVSPPSGHASKPGPAVGAGLFDQRF